MAGLLTGPAMPICRLGINRARPRQGCGSFLKWRMFLVGEPVPTSPEHALGPCRLSEPAKHREHQWLALEIILVGVVSGLVDLVPGFRDAQHPLAISMAIHMGEAVCEPFIDGIDEAREPLRLEAAERVAKRMQCLWIDYGQPFEQIDDALAQRERRTFEQGQSAPDAAFSQRRGLAQVRLFGSATERQR